MKTKIHIALNEAIEEAIKFGFRNRFVLRNETIHFLLTNKDFSYSEFAIVKKYPVVFNNGNKGSINYIVLNNGQLGFFVNETKNVVGLTVDSIVSDERIAENIYST